MREAIWGITMARARMKKSWRKVSSANSIQRMGANTMTLVAVPASTAFHTCRQPPSAASSRGRPRRRSRTMFS
jgi:hypothetical protein